MPITGAPQAFGESVKYDDILYRKLYDYTGMVTYVLGEFYWRLQKDERTANSDYVGTGSASSKRLNREQTAGAGSAEVVWSAGETLSADAILNAFRLAPAQRAALQRDALPTTFKGRCSARSSSGSSSSSSSCCCFAAAEAVAAPIAARLAIPSATPRRSTRIALNSQRSGGGYRGGGGVRGLFQRRRAQVAAAPTKRQSGHDNFRQEKWQ